MVELMKMMVTSFQRSRACTATLRAPTLQQAAADPHLPGDSWTLPGESGPVSCGVPAPFSWVLVHKVCLCPPRVHFPVLGKFSWLYGGVNGDLLPEGLCHTQVCGTQSPCPCGRPLLTRISSGDTQTQFCELGTSIMPIFLVKTQEEKLGQTSPYIVQREFKHVHASL